MLPTVSLSAQLEALGAGLALARVAAPSLLRLVGPDRVETLQRLVTQDVKTLAEAEVRLSLLLAPKGQARALFAVGREENALLLLAAAGQGERLAGGLATYLRLSRSRLEPVECAPEALLLAGPGFTDMVADAASRSALAAGRLVAAGGVLYVPETLAGIAGAFVLAAEPAALDPVVAAAVTAGAIAVGAEALLLARIAARFPAWGAELTETVLPPEVGIEARTISYTKGCYIGQETMARMRTYGRPNRALVTMRQLSGEPLSGLPLPLHQPGEERTRGHLTSFARHPEQGGMGLALVRREVAGAGTRLEADGGQLMVVEP